MKEDLEKFIEIWKQAETNSVNKIFNPKWPQKFDEEDWKNERKPVEGINHWNELEKSKQTEKVLKLISLKADKHHLQWIYDRMLNVHNEDKNYDYMLKFKEIIDRI